MCWGVEARGCLLICFRTAGGPAFAAESQPWFCCSALSVACQGCKFYAQSSHWACLVAQTLPSRALCSTPFWGVCFSCGVPWIIVG